MGRLSTCVVVLTVAILALCAVGSLAAGEQVRRLDAVHFSQYMRQLLTEEELRQAPEANEVVETALIELGMQTRSTARLRMNMKARAAMEAQALGTLSAATAAQIGARVGDDDKCRVLLNTWIGKCVFGV